FIPILEPERTPPDRLAPTLPTRQGSKQQDTGPLWPFSAGTVSCGSFGSTTGLTSTFTEQELKDMTPVFTDSRTSIRLKGTAVPGATDRQEKIAGFDQAVFSA